MSKRKFNESEDKPHNDNDRDDFKKLKRSNTEPVGPIPKSNSDLEVTVPNLNKMPTMNPKKFAEISSDEESKKELGHDTSPDESEKSESEQMYFSDDETGEESIVKKTPKAYQNILFYQNKRKSTPQGDFIENILKYWEKDYNKLEIHHGYIQWLFPNFYGSAFNRDAFKLEKEEAKKFREDKIVKLGYFRNFKIAERLQRAYKLILDFYGMVLENPKTGKLARSKDYAQRYHKTLITSLHNHLRIRRILAHLNVVGFRKYAIELVKFLETEIYGDVGEYKNYLANRKNLTSDHLKKLKANPLYPIIRYDVFKDWKLYGETENDEDLKKLHENCFTSDPDDYSDSVILKEEIKDVSK